MEEILGGGTVLLSVFLGTLVCGAPVVMAILYAGGGVLAYVIGTLGSRIILHFWEDEKFEV